MSLISWFNSANQVDTALVVVGIVGAIIEVGVAVVAVINVHKEISESRKKILEKYLEIFACVAAFFFLAEAILACRSSQLLGVKIEGMERDNLTLRSNVVALELKVQPRTITLEQKENFKKFMSLVSKIPIKISIGQEGFDTETYAKQMRDMFTYAGFGISQDSGTWGIFRDPTRLAARQIGDNEESAFAAIVYYTTNESDFGTAGEMPYAWRKIKSPYTNFSDIPIVIDTNSTRAIFEAIDCGFKSNGIPVKWLPENQWVKSNEFEIYIPLKNL